MLSAYASPRSIRTLARVAIVAIASVVASVSIPLSAAADSGVTVYQVDAPEYSILVVRDGSELNLTMTNNGTVTTTVGVGADLDTAGVTERLWESDVPMLADATWRELAPGESVTEWAPFLPGVTITFYRGIESTPEAIGHYLTPGHHLRFVLTAVPTPEDTYTLEFGPAVTVLPGSVVPGGGVGIVATDLPPGPTSAFIDPDPALDVVGDEFVVTPSSGLMALGSGTVAADGTVTIRGVVPPGTEPGDYTVLFQNASGIGVHFSTAPLSVVSGVPMDVDTGTVTLTGAAAIGSVLRAQTQSWGPPGVTLLYSWAADGVTIPGADRAAYTVKRAQADTALTVTVTGWGTGYSSRSVTSQPSDIVPANSFIATTVPTIDGAAVVGQKLQATVPAWTPGAKFSYRWSIDGIPVGVDSLNYVPTAEDAGKPVTVSVTGSRVGYTDAVAVSAVSEPVALGELQVPATRPTIGGQKRVGGTLTLVLGTWKPVPEFAIQWMVDDVPIPGAHDVTLVVPASVNGVSTLGVTVSAEVTATALGYNPVIRTAVATAPIAAGIFSPKGELTITGTLGIGQTLTADAGSWAPAPEFSYQWKVAGVVQPGETGSTFVIPATAHNKKVSVTTVASLDGYTSVTRNASTPDKVA